MKQHKIPETIPEWVAGIAENILEIGHRTGWGEMVLGNPDGSCGIGFSFVTLDDAKARQALALLGAAGLLCETDTAMMSEAQIDLACEHADVTLTQQVMSVVDLLRELAR